MRKSKLFILALAALVSSSAFGQNWQDVTSTYLQNAGFDESTDWQTTNIAVNPATLKDVTDWTSNGSSSWAGSAAFGFGGIGQINGVSIPAKNSDDEATGGCVAITGSWDDGAGFAQYTQQVTLPAGSYKLTFKVNNVGTNDNFRTSLFGFETSSKKYYGTTTSYPVGTWTTEVVDFSLSEETTGSVSVGFGWKHTGSNNTPKLVVDYVKLEVDNTVDKSNLETLITEAEGLYDAGKEGASDFLTAINAAKAVKDNASATAGDVLAAESALKAAMDAFNLANASEENPFDVTSWIQNPGFEAGTGEWTLNKTMSGWVDCTINTTAPSEGNNCYNLWAGSVTSIDLHQDVTLPRGNYELTADFRIDNMVNVTDQGVYAKVGEKTSKSTSTITNVASTWNSKEGWNNISVQFTVLEATSVRIGASSKGTGENSAGWFQVDNFTLKCIGQPSDEEAINAIKGEISTLLGQVPSGKMNADINTELDAKKTNAEADLSDKTLEQLTTIKEELATAIGNATASVTAYSNINTALTTYADKVNSLNDAGKAAYDVSAIQTGYNSGTIEGDGTSEIAAIKAAFATAAVAQGPGADITCLLTNPSFEENPDNGWSVTRNTTGQWNYGQKNNDTEADPNSVKEGTNVLDVWAPQINWINVKQTVTLPAGKYVMTAGVFVNGEQNIQRIYLGDNNDSEYPAVNNQWNLLVSPVLELNAQSDVNLGFYSQGKNQSGNSDGWFRADNVRLYLADATANMTVTDAKYATFCAPFDVTIPSGVTASTVTGTSGNTLTLQTVETTIPANTPVVLQSETPVNTTFFGVAETGTPTAGLLTGVYTATDAPEGSYVLVSREGIPSFAQVGASPKANVPANRAYLTASNGAKEFFFDDATAIDKVDTQMENSKSVNDTYYNLAGQKVGTDYKGIVIVNGKKVLNK